MIVVAAVLSLIMGITLGLLGGGGSILTVPILTEILGLPGKEAIATSLLVVGATAAVSTVPHARAGNVDGKTGLVFALFAMAGSYLGGRLAVLFSSTVLLILFAVLMVVTAVAMLRKRSPAPGAAEPEPRPMSVPKVAAEGLVVGAVTGLVGAGGGFLVVPALVVLGGVPMRRAVGTSLLVIALKSLTGYFGHAAHTSIDWTLTGIVTGCAVAGTFVGVALVRRLDPNALRRAFAYFVLVMGILFMAKQATVLLSNEDPAAEQAHFMR
jgi:hypothetical protein